MSITAAEVNKLRKQTGAGMMDCKKALTEANGDFESAIEILRKKGQKVAAKRSDREAGEGAILAGVSSDGNRGVVVSLNCETDFVANSEPFQEFSRNVALHIANMAPEYVRREDVPEAVISAERSLQLRILKEDPKNASKPDDILQKIIEGRMDKFFEELVLMEQEFLLDDSKTVSEALSEVVAKVGESCEIRRFARYALGEDGGSDDA